MKLIKKHTTQTGFLIELYEDESFAWTYRYAIQVSYNDKQVDGYNKDKDCFAKTCKMKLKRKDSNMELKSTMITIPTTFVGSYDYQDLIERILMRIETVEELTDEDQIMQAINDELIYYDDMWMLAREFNNSPAMEEKSWDECLEQLTNDVMDCALKIYEEYKYEE